MLKNSLFTLLVLLSFTTPAMSITPALPSVGNPHILVLAGSCAACHGTNGLSLGGTPVLAGLDKGYFVKRMLEYQKQTESTEVMPQQARALTSEELILLGEYFSMQPRSFTRFQSHSLKSHSQTRFGE
ncbi:hypothetical protein QN379_03950 [Glaciimonas sp. Gout2]|uniref:c-type cytochrome n=1 Tax=unclassified Glaciimonas TaxID=2644401 RepID=UPI002AB5A016|nr:MULTISPECIES: hypothetical protein [unclassified Glaciimonas]MDY7546996.1 hypothetical protein [Glaciimonas sp. CA11.2]MEB0011157.1 hypothetical protein [Glaciimonas sp. Cout2]MEB0081166.1 hypothetical protein [Glaciimonas sp. Gout2]